MPKKPSPKVSTSAGTRVTQSPIRLTKALTPDEFRKLTKHIGPVEQLSFAALERLLIEKGIISQIEYQQMFLDEAERRGF
jgi:hypothetical protein